MLILRGGSLWGRNSCHPNMFILHVWMLVCPGCEKLPLLSSKCSCRSWFVQDVSYFHFKKHKRPVFLNFWGTRLSIWDEHSGLERNEIVRNRDLHIHLHRILKVVQLLSDCSISFACSVVGKINNIPNIFPKCGWFTIPETNKRTFSMCFSLNMDQTKWPCGIMET